MKRFLLQYLKPADDVDFLNITEIEFSFVDGENDSGWCDATTGARIVSANDSIIFETKDRKEETVLQLKFGDRLKDY